MSDDPAGDVSDPWRSPVVRSFSLPNGSKITSLRESTLRAGLKAASLALKTERALNQTSRVHWTLLDPEATDEEMLRMDDEGYVGVSAERAGIQVGRIDLGQVEPRHLTQTEQRMMDGALRRSLSILPDPEVIRLTAEIDRLHVVIRAAREELEDEGGEVDAYLILKHSGVP